MTTQELRSMTINYTEQELVEERWKDIKNFEDYYEVSSLGRFRSKKRTIIRSNGVSETKSGRILKNNYYSNGYVQLILYVEKVRYNFLGHRVVAEHFIPAISDKLIVNHKNCLKWDNRVSNLEWCNHSENYIHAVDAGLVDKTKISGENSLSSKISEEEAIYIKANYRHFGRNKDLYLKFENKIGKKQISEIAKGNYWKHLNHFIPEKL